jgi:hypothetical protein
MIIFPLAIIVMAYKPGKGEEEAGEKCGNRGKTFRSPGHGKKKESGTCSAGVEARSGS